jgi:hypothetical protein
MKEPKTPSKLTRAQLTQALDSVPVSHILGKSASRELTPKQRAFALEVAKGSTKADAYRKAYKPTSKWTMQTQPYQLSKDERVSNEIEAIKRAIAAQEYQTPAALRALVIQSLVGVITNPDAQPGQITAAAKVLGTVTEVAAFTVRSEQRIIRSSDDARAELMAQIREITKASATDVTAIDQDADSLLAELAATDSGGDETHPPATPQTVESESPVHIHTIPHEQSAIPHEQSPNSFGSHSNNDADNFLARQDPPSSAQEDPPSSFEK